MPQKFQIQGGPTLNFPDDATQEEIQQAIQKYVGPSSSTGGAFGRGALSGLLPSAATVGTGVALEAAAAPETVGGSLLLIPPTLLAGYLASKGQQKVIHKVAPQFEQQQAADVAQHPWATTAGGLASALPFARLAPGQILNPKKAYIPAGIGALTGAVQPLAEGRTPNLQDILGGAAGMALYGKSRDYVGGSLQRLSSIAKAAKILPNAAKEAGVSVAAERAKTAQDVLGGIRTPASGTKATPQPSTEAPTPKESLTPAEQAAEDAYNQAVTEAKDVPGSFPVERGGDEQSPDNPFAGNTARVMTIRRPNPDVPGDPGAILVHPQRLQKWAAGLPDNLRGQLVRSALHEEAIHLATPDDQAASYWNGLSGIEKAIERRLYPGVPRGANEATLMGHEALRRRLQQLARIRTTEAAQWRLVDRIPVQTMEAISRAVGAIRKALGTKVSREQSAILDRVNANLEAAKAATGKETPGAQSQRPQEGDEFLETGAPRIPTGEQARRAILQLDQQASAAKAAGNLNQAAALFDQSQKLKQSFPDWEQQAFPAAINRRIKETSEQGRMFLPPLEREAKPERSPFEQASPKLIESAAEEHFGSQAKPSYETFRGELEQRFGSLKESATREAWQDASMKRLLAASPEELSQLLRDNKLWKDVHDAMGETERGETQGSAKEIAAPIRVEQIPEGLTAAQVRAWVRHARNIRGKQRGSQSIEAMRPQYRRWAAIGALADHFNQQLPKAPTAEPKAEVGPEAVAQVFRVKQPSREVVEGGQPTGDFTQPSYETKPVWHNFTVDEMSNPQRVGELATAGGRLHGERVSRTRSVIAVEDRKTGRITLASTWKDPRRGYLMEDPSGSKTGRVFNDFLLRDYNPIATMRLREPRGFLRQHFPDAQAFYQHFGDIGLSAEELPASEVAEPGTTAAEQPAKPEQGVVSETARELTTPGRPQPIPRQRILSSMPRAEAPRMLSQGGERFAREAAIQEQHPFTPSEAQRYPAGTLAELAKRNLSVEPYAKGERPAETVPNYPGEFGKRPTQQDLPAAMDLRALKEEAQAVGKGVANFITSQKPREEAIVAYARLQNQPAITARRQSNYIRLASVQKPTGGILQRLTDWTRGNKQVLDSAQVQVESAYKPEDPVEQKILGTTKGGLPNEKALNIFRILNNKAITEATKLTNSKSWREQRTGRAWLAEAQRQKAELEYARDHWLDKDFTETSNRAREIYKNQLDQLKDAGYDITEVLGYHEHMYNASVVSNEPAVFQAMKGGVDLLGKEFTKERRFPTRYHALAEGPYIQATHDIASQVEHYVRNAQTRILGDTWPQALYDIKLPDGRPLALPPGTEKPPQDYEQVQLGSYRGAPAIFVQDKYAGLIENLASPSKIDRFDIKGVPVAKVALHLSQVLKHSFLAGDFFHLGRINYYALAIMGKQAGFRGGWTALDIAPEDTAEAVSKGLIRQKDADWAAEPVKYGNATVSRRELVKKFYQAMGANLGRIQDALYKDLATEAPAGAGPLRRGFSAAMEPTMGRYNRLLFDKMTRGFMAEANVREFERQMKSNPEANPDAIMRDIAKDVNGFFGNIGNEGLFTNKTWQDINRLLFLAPQWVEGLIKKEGTFLARASQIPQMTGQREGLTNMGTTGRAIGRGLLAMVAVTQAINLITRGKTTFQNDEKGHSMDAFIPGWGSDQEGFWLSPLSLFMEVSHDLYRLLYTKPTAADAAMQIVANKEQPLTRALMVAALGQTPTGEKLTTTGNRLATAASYAAPVPISFGKLGQEVGHAVAPSLVQAPRPGSTLRQALATFTSLKVEPKETASQEVMGMARDFMRKEGLEKETGWQQVQTDEPSYSKLRGAIRAGNLKQAETILNQLRKNRTDQKIVESMRRWAKTPFTGSRQTERLFLGSLNDQQMQAYNHAVEDRLKMLQSFEEWYAGLP